MATDPEIGADDHLAAITVGQVETIDGPVRLTEPDPQWPAQYDAESRRIRRALGDRVHRLEHVGSTAVPGLVAKPIIDIVLAVADSSDEAAYVPPLEAIGYEVRIREPDDHQHRMLRKRPPDPAVHLHVYTEGTTEIDRMVAFRDHLRRHRDDLDRYAATKRALAARRWRHVQQYADAKTPVIDEILARAGIGRST